MIFNIIRNKTIFPFVIVVSHIKSDDENKNYVNHLKKIYEILFINEIINEKCVLLFCLFNDYEKKKIFSHQCSTINIGLEQLLKNKELLEAIILKCIQNHDFTHEIEITNEKQEIKEKNINLSFLANHWK